MGSGYLGLRTGLGSIMATADTGGMIVLAVVILTCALVAFAVLDGGSSRGRFIGGLARPRRRPRPLQAPRVAAAGVALAGHAG